MALATKKPDADITREADPAIVELKTMVEELAVELRRRK